METIVIYKSKYGSTKKYAQWISEELKCDIKTHKETKIEDLEKYDTVIYGGGLYGEVIAGVSLITKNIEKLKNKKIIIFTTGLTPVDYREYYDNMVMEKNFKGEVKNYVKVFNFRGKMIVKELSFPHKTAITALKKLMASKEEPTESEKLLLTLCDCDGDFTDKKYIKELLDYAKE